MKRTMLAATLAIFAGTPAYACPPNAACYEGHPTFHGASGVCSTWELDTYPGIEFSIIGNSTSDFAMVGMTPALWHAAVNDPKMPAGQIQIVSNGQSDEACQHAVPGDANVVGVRRAGLP